MKTRIRNAIFGALIFGNSLSVGASATMKEALEAFDLKSLRFYSSSQFENCGRTVSVIDPKGYVHYARVGNYLGRHKGQITRVDEGNVWITEIHMDSSGKRQERETVVKIEKKNN